MTLKTLGATLQKIKQKKREEGYSTNQSYLTQE